MNRDDKVMLYVGIVAAFSGFFAPIVRVPYLHHVLIVCTAISLVLCLAVLVRGAFPRMRGK